MASLTDEEARDEADTAQRRADELQTQAGQARTRAEIGKQGSWAAVRAAYAVMYKNWWGKPRDLEADLRSSLSTDEYQRFMRVAS